jgi:hypothetical protein
MATSFRSLLSYGNYKANADVLAQTTSGTFITINTTPPVVSAGPDYTIPKIHLTFESLSY